MIYHELKRAIISGALSPGQTASIDRMAAAHGVSRTPVREAFLQLAEEGLMVVTPQVGAKVAPVDLRQVYEAQFVREVLERACLATGAQSANREALASFDRALRRQGAAIREREYATFYQWDETFHNLMCSMSGHAGISKIINSARAHLDRLRQLSLRDNLRLMQQLFDDHRAIVEALKRHNESAADRALRRHLRRIFDYVDELLRRHPEFFVDRDLDLVPRGDAVAPVLDGFGRGGRGRIRV